MSVVLLRHTPDPERVVALAARLCYSPLAISDLESELRDEDVGRLISLLVRVGHTSPFEHASFTFGIEGSRAALNQLVRHRIASYSQQSQRYVRVGAFDCVQPPSISATPEARDLLRDATEHARTAYAKLLALGVPKEDARYVLPMGTLSRIIATFNARSLHNLFQMRCCERAQWEIRGIAREMLSLVREVAPRLFIQAGPPCESLGLCREGAMSCGRLERVKREGADSG